MVAATLTGKVFFVGVGLGGPEYLTRQAIAVLAQGEVALYDGLMDPRILALLPDTCERIGVGKRGGEDSTDQGTINDLLIHHGQRGKRVLRLKGGDPWIFGRLVPELAALTQAGLPFEVIPGLSSAIAAPGLAGIPLTALGSSGGFWVMDGHDPHQWDWSILAQLETLVILMGGRTLPQIIQALIQAGKDPTTAIALIHQGGRPAQRQWVGTLADMVEKTQGHRLSPAVIVIGPVVNHRVMLDPSPLPLADTTVLVTRAADQASAFTQLLTASGATVLEMPALTLTPPSSWDPLDQAIADLDQFDWLMLTSANGVNFFFERLQAKGFDSRALAGVHISVVGQKTAQALAQYGLTPDFVPPDFIADAVVPHFPVPLAGLNVLFPRVEAGGRAQLVQDLQAHQAQVREVPAYQSLCPTAMDPTVWEALVHHCIDVITFASAKTVSHFSTLLSHTAQAHSYPHPLSLLHSLAIASIGPQTSLRCREDLGRVDIEAQTYTLEGLRDSLIAWKQSH